MKRILLMCALSLLAAQILVAPLYASQSGDVDWNKITSWKLDAKPLDLVHSLDNQKVYILGDDSKVHIFSAKGAKLGAIPVAEGVTAIDIEPRGTRLYLINEKDNTFTSLAISFVTPIDITGSPFLGNENAPVVLVVFSDFQCPYCGRIPQLLEQLLENNPQTVKIVFKNLPLTRIHKIAEPAALAALAAHKQGKFWQMHDAIFAIGGNKLNMEKIVAAAREIGLDMEQFNNDRTSPAVKQQLAKDLADAREAQVTGTPTLLVNGRLISDRSPQALQKAVDREMAKSR